MVLYYGLFALETANNTIAATTKSAASQRGSLLRKSKASEKMNSSSNSWIYTEDLKKRFEKRYGDHHYIFIPVYINGKNTLYYYNSIAMIPQKSDGENSWMYSRSLRNHLFNSTSKISSTTSCVTNQRFIQNEVPIKAKLFQRLSSSSKEKSTTSLSSTNRPEKYRSTEVVVEEEDESIENENHSRPLIKHSSVIPSHLTTESSNNNSMVVQITMNNELSNAKHVTTNSNRLTRIRSFFFKSSSSLSGT